MERTRHPGIYRRGDKVVAVVSYRESGRKRQKWLSASTVRGALDARRKFLNQLEGGLKPTGSRTKLRDYIESTWLPEVARTRRPATAASYRKAVKNHILPRLGEMALRDIDSEALQGLYRALTPVAAQYAHDVLSSAFTYAVKDLHLLSVNPSASVRRPQVAKKETRHLEVAEAKRMLSLAKGQRLEGAIVLGLVGGLRLAEVCGLHWGDVNTETGAVIVRGSYYGPTKSGKPRGLTLPVEQMAALKRYKAGQAQDLLRFGIAQDDDTPIMATWDGRAMNPDTLAATFTAFCSEHGFDVSFHGLRHTAAILMLTSGVDVKTAASRLGHTPRLLLEVYSHYIGSADKAAADRLGAMLRG